MREAEEANEEVETHENKVLHGADGDSDGENSGSHGEDKAPMEKEV